MKWKANPYPREGDKRTIKKFAFIPERLSDNTVVWFEFYFKDQTYREAELYISDYWSTNKSYQ